MAFIVGILGNLISDLISDTGSSIFQDVTDNVTWKKWKAEHELSKNESDFLDRYAETLVTLKKERKPKELLQFYGEESVINLIQEHWYTKIDNTSFDHHFSELTQWFTLEKQLDGFSPKQEIALFLKRFGEAVHQNRTAGEAEIYQKLDAILNEVKNEKPKLEKDKFKIVEYKNERDLFSITILNNSSDSKFIKNVELKLSNRNPLAFFITPMNATPYSNKEILINFLPNRDNYSVEPNIYIKPKSAEILNFRLHRPHAYHGYEIMETIFEITTDDNEIYKTEKLIDYIGHFEMILKIREEFQQEKKDTIVPILEYNREIIQGIANSKLKKSNRLTRFLDGYLKQESELEKIYKLKKKARR